MSDLDEMPRSNSTAQWIISLAISVVCCACLFVVLAFYITDQHIMVSSVSLRMDLLQQRQDRLSNEIELLRRSAPMPQAQRTVVPQAATQDQMPAVDADDKADVPNIVLPKGSMEPAKVQAPK